MNLVVQREPSVEGATLGKLFIDGHHFCETLEDELREQQGIPVDRWKVPGATAIPAGTYTVILDYSQRFQRMMPHVLGVDGFTGIRIHSGNVAADTEGCLLVGFDRAGGPSRVINSRMAFDKLFDMLRAADKAEQRIQITYCNPPQAIVAQ